MFMKALDISTLENKVIALPQSAWIQLPSDATLYPRRKGSAAIQLQKLQNSVLFSITK
jgi:hypothetical protein